MGFFSELKEDLSQAVNELVSDEEQATDYEAAEQPVEDILELPEEDEVDHQEGGETSVPETAEELSRMLDNMNLDMEEEPEVEEPEDEEPEEILLEEPEEADESEEEIFEEIIEEQEETKVREEEIQMEETQNIGMEAEDIGMTGDAVDETALITAGMTIKGDISSQGSLNVVGTVEGNIDILGKLNITGNIEGSSKAADVYAEKARINGDIHSGGSIKIGQSTIIIGNIFATSAVIAGAVKGDIDVKGPVILDTSAIVMGNIKSKSVQINNGAVIEGLCSQCYADVNPSSFFEDIKKARKK